MEEAVADGVGDGGVADVVVPLRGWDLAGEDGGAVSIAVLDDLEEVAALLVLGWGEAPVVDDEDVGAGEPSEEDGIGAGG